MSLPQDWVQVMMDHYAQGYSDPEICRLLGISKKQFQQYIARSQPFADLVEYGHDLAEAWALEQNRKFVTDKDITANNVKALEKRLENMHGWSSKVESKNANLNLEADVAKLKQELASIAPDMLKSIGQDRMALQLTHNEVSSDEE